MFGGKGAMWINEAHIAKDGHPRTLCDAPMLSSNWCRIADLKTIGCRECIAKYDAITAEKP